MTPGPGLPRGLDLADAATDQIIRADRHAFASGLHGPVQPFQRVTEQLTRSGGMGFTDVDFQSAYLQDIGKTEWKTPEHWIAELDPDSALGRVTTRELGEHSIGMLRASTIADHDRAVVGSFEAFLTVTPPHDGGLSYAPHRFVTGKHVDIGASTLIIAPANAPVRHAGSDQYWYPEWEAGRDRMNQSVALVSLSRVEGRLPLMDASPRKVFEDLPPWDANEVFPCYLDPDLLQTRQQMLLSFTAGYTPIYRAQVVLDSSSRVKGMREAVERTSKAARIELAVRLNEPAVIDMNTSNLQALAERLRRLDSSRVNPRGVEEDVFTTASVDQLLAMALRERKRPRVFYATYEWEHYCSQRVPDSFATMFEVMKLGPKAGSDMRRLSRLCDPANLHLVSPLEHARLDYYAAFVRGRKAANSARFDHLGNSLVSENFWLHPDLERASNPVVSFEPVQLHEMFELLHSPEIQRATRLLKGNHARNWNGLVDQMNHSAEFLGLSGPKLDFLPTGK